MKKSILISLLLLSSLVFADTPPPGSVQLRGGTDNTIIGNTGNALNVNVTGGSGASTANQGTPAPAASAWPVYLPSPIPSQTVSVSNFPAFPSNQDVTVTNFPSTQPVSGTVNIGNFPSPAPTQPVTGTVDIGNFPSVQTITGSIGVLNFPVNQNVTITGTPSVTVSNQLTNYALESGGNLATISSTLTTINGKLSNPQPVTVGNFPATQPISGAVSISGTVPVTGNVGITGTVGVNGTVIANIGTPGGLALNSTLESISAQLPASLGQATMANSFPVVISSNQSAIPVTGSFTATNASIGLNGSSAPTSSTEIGAVDSFGNLQHLNITGAGALKTDSSAVTQPVSGSVSVSNLPSTQNVNVTNASIPVTGTFYQSIQPVSQSGSWSTGRTWTLSSGTDSVNVGNFPSSFGVTQSTSPWVVSGTVTSNIGTTGGLALDSTVSGLEVSQGSSTSGQKGNLIQGAVSSSLPSYTNGQTNPLSLTTSGALRVDGSATTQPVTGSGTFTVVQSSGANLHVDVDSGTVTVGNQISNYAQESGGNLANISTNSNQLPTIATNTATTATNVATVNTTLGTTNTNTANTVTNTATIISNQTNGTQKDNILSTVPPNDTVNTGTLSSMVSVVTIPANGIAGGGITITGAFSGNIQIQGSTTGGMYQNIETLQSGLWTYAPITVPGFYKFRDADGYQTVNALFTTYVSGTPTVRIEGTTAVGSIAITNPTPGNLNATVYQPTGTNLHTVVDSGSISITSSALPAGAATSTNQVTQISDLGTIISNQTNGSQETQVTNFPSVQAVSQSGTWTTGRTWTLSESTDSVSSWLSDGSGNSISSTTGSLNVNITNTVPVSQSGTWNLNNISGTISLPTGAATNSELVTINTTLGSPFQVGGSIGNTAFGISGTLPAFAATPTVNLGTISTASTAANQITQIGYETTIASNTTGILDNQTNGTQEMQIVEGGNVATVTSSNALKVDGSAITQPVSGTVIANAGTGNFTVVQPTGSNLHVVVDTAPTTAVTQATSPWINNISQFGGNNVLTGTGVSGIGIPRVTVSNDSNILSTQSGTWTTGRTWSLLNSTDSISSWLDDGSGNAITSTLIDGTHQALDVNAVGITTATVGDLSNSGTITTTCSTPTLSCPAGSFVPLFINGVASAQIQVEGTFTGASLNVDGTVDGVNWAALLTASGSIGNYATTSFSSTGKYRIFRIAGLTQLRVRASALASGSATIDINSSIGSNLTEVVQLSSANLLTNSWLSDGSGNALSSTTGSLNVDVTNTVPVSQSGTWTIQPGNTPNTSPWLTTINQGGNSATVTASNALKVDGSAVTQPISGTVTTIAPSTSSASLSSVNNANSSFAILASNSSRKGVIIYNNSTTSCNFAFASTASNTAFSFPLTTHSTYVMTPPIYQGAISAICTAATGNTQITEF